jgi:ACS family hexuronate transporter-like MFS transporter
MWCLQVVLIEDGRSNPSGGMAARAAKAKMSYKNNHRWWIAGFLAFVTALSYLVRQNFPVAVTEIAKQIVITDKQFSQLQMLFLLPYAVMYAGGGKIADWLGTRKSYSLMMLWWSCATILHGLANSVFGLGIARLLLGIGEGGGFPCSSKVVSERFSPEDRALAFGIFNTGGTMGAAIAPPLIALIVLTLGWRWVFFLTGTIGFAAALAWWFFYDSPPDPTLPTTAAGPLPSIKTQETKVSGDSWIGLLGKGKVWGLISAKFFSDSAWFFFIFWLPKYFSDVRHLNILQIGYYSWIPYAVAGVGSYFGGWFSGFLIRRHLTVGASRKICLGLSAAMLPSSLLIAKSPLWFAIVLFSIALFGHQFWSTILQTIPADLFPSRMVGSVAGLMGAGGSFGGLLFGLLVGQILTRDHSYSLPFLIAGLLHPLSFLLILLFVPKVQPRVNERSLCGV